VLNDDPRSAFIAGSELFTYMVAEPSSDKYISSSYSYCLNNPDATPQPAEQPSVMTSSAAAAQFRIIAMI
jgi:hypothetical protein